MEETTRLIWIVLFGAIGLGYLTYGRRQSAIVPLVVGFALLVVPHLIGNSLLMLASCLALAALPYFIRY